MTAQKDYIYAYLRSNRGYGNECNIISFPINYAASVNFGLAFMHTWRDINPQWNSKDLIVLFYNDHDPKTDKLSENYSKSVSEFLSQYYLGYRSWS